MTNVGLIGCGRVSELHMGAYKYIPEANVVAVSDLNLDRAKVFAQRHGVKKAFKDYLELLEMGDLDYVDICTPTTTHTKIACEAAKSGHNILLEKPMARTSAECDKILDAISKHNVKLSVCHNQLFIPLVMQAKTMVDSGEFPLSYFRVSVMESAEMIGAPSWIMTPEQGGVLWETGAHASYLQLHFLKDVEEVSAVGEKVNYPVHDHFIAMLRSPDQVIGVIEISWLAKKMDIKFELTSSAGEQMQILNYNYLMQNPRKLPKNLLQGFYWDQKNITTKWIKSFLNNLRNRHVITCLHQYILIKHYINAIKNDTELPVKPEDGRKTVRLLEYISESLQKNQPIKVDLMR